MYKVTIKHRSDSFKVYLCDTKAQFKRLTGQDLWDKITEEDDDYTSDNLELVFRGTRLDDDDSLYEAGVRNGSEIQLVRRHRKEFYDRMKAGIAHHGSMDRLADFDVCVVQ